MSDILEDLGQAVFDMDEDTTVELTEEAIDEGLDPEVILNDSLVPAMDEVGEEYEKGERYVPEMLLSAEAMKGAMELIRPLLAESGVEPAGIVVIGTVEGDLHDIGQNLVSMMLEGAGFEVINLGAETPAEEFVEAIKEHDANVLGMSALLTTTMTHMPDVIEALEEEGVREQVDVAIGGAPVSQDYADEIGADGYAADAAAAVNLVKDMTDTN
ncbi:corrinoid protein [Candidatus Bipolaricaulota bacterium]|nr:corrinoid protein [Candidatus Bipolaricaulota bacterium]